MAYENEKRPGSTKHFTQDPHPVHRLYALMESSSKKNRSLASFLLRNVYDVPALTIAEVATRAGVSKSSVVRMCNQLGYKGYRDFRMAMAENRGMLRGSAVLGSDIPPDMHPEEPLSSLAQKVIQINVEVLLDTLRLVDLRVLEQVVDAIFGANYVYLFAIGSSAPVALDAQQRFLRLGIRAHGYTDPHVIANAVVYAGKEDLVFAVSYSGASRDVVETLALARQGSVRTVLLTSIPESPASRYADLTLLSSVRRAPIPAETVASRISQLAIIDILCAAIGLRMSDERIKKAEEVEWLLTKRRIAEVH